MPRLYVDAFAIYSAIFGLPALVLFFNRPLAEQVLHAEGVSPWFGLIPLIGLLVVLLLRANYQAHAALHDDLLAARLEAKLSKERLETEPRAPSFRLLSKPV